MTDRRLDEHCDEELFATPAPFPLPPPFNLEKTCLTRQVQKAEEETRSERAIGFSQLVCNNMQEYYGQIDRAADTDRSMYICLERKRT